MGAAVQLLVLVAANVVGAAMSLPQAVRLLRTRRVEGVSLGWAAMSVVTNGWWLSYGLGAGNWAIVPVSVVSVVGYLLVVGAVLRFGGRRGAALGRSGAAGLAAVVVVPAMALAFGGLVSLGIALGLVYGVQLAPAVLGAYRSSDLRGVSAGTWLAAWVEAGLWGVLGVHGGDAGLLALAVTGLVMSSALLVRLTRWNLAVRAQPAFALSTAG